jgi:dihydrolipoamide dehydrogenase
VSRVPVLCPDLGDFKEVPVIDVLVKPGDVIEIETPLITLETDKATMDVPSPAAGSVIELLVDRGSSVSKGTPLLTIESAAATAAPEPKPTPAPAAEPEPTRTTQVLVLGAGPGGYSAAFRAADLGLKVTLVERSETLGGVCLNVGCIPSKALLHAAKVIEEAREMSAHGIVFGPPTVDTARLRAWTLSVIRKLTGGLTALAKQRKVEVVRGSGRFISPHVLEVTQGDGRERIRFDYCIIAAGSEPMRLPFVPQDPRVIDSTGALEVLRNPGRFLVIGGGIIGLEMACVYDALGARVSVVELTSQLMPGCDPDLVRPLEKRIRARYAGILLDTKVTAVKATSDGLVVSFTGKDGASSSDTFDHVLVAVGRTPNGRQIGAEAAGVAVDERGYIASDRQMRTNVPHIFAIGDVHTRPATRPRSPPRWQRARRVHSMRG